MLSLCLIQISALGQALSSNSFYFSFKSDLLSLFLLQISALRQAQLPAFTLYFNYRFMSSPYRNCELSRKDVRTVGQSGLDYALGWVLYHRASYAGICSRNGRRQEVENSPQLPLARYERAKIDYSVVSRAVLQRKSVVDAQQCARECDLHRSVYECQAFSYTYVKFFKEFFAEPFINTNLSSRAGAIKQFFHFSFKSCLLSFLYYKSQLLGRCFPFHCYNCVVRKSKALYFTNLDFVRPPKNQARSKNRIKRLKPNI